MLVALVQTPTLLFSQSARDQVVPLAAAVQLDPARVTLSWSNPASAPDIQLFRREKGATTWYILLSEPASTQLSFIDSLVEPGQIYEYGIQQHLNSAYSYGYLSVAIAAPAVDFRGTLLVFVEEALQMPLAVELDRMNQDLVGDGWKTVWHAVAPGDSVSSIKAQILADYNADPQQVKSVLLLGDIPVPYSGDANWDGHADHAGAWPADTYYGDLDFEWLDEFVNNVTPSRPQNDNVPGDGKFDHSITPTTIELAVGRVDFSNLSEETFGTTRLELYRRYLNKNHRWRTGQYQVENRALVDDNFGYFAGEAFAANGYRNGNALVGEANVVDGDFINDTDGSQSFLLGYGCGPGTYTQAGGVATSSQFATDTVNVVFAMIFGSYHGDWDYSPNPLLPSALASNGGILSASWAGRPHWFYHHLTAGETLGYCTLETQNACDNAGYFNSIGNCGAHVTLLGDPTLRAQVVMPPSNPLVYQACNSLEVVWTSSPQADVLGYLVYRSVGADGDYIRLTNEPVTNISFTDSMPPEGLLSYQVRAVALEQTPGGSFYNTSTGAFATFDFSPFPPLSVNIEGGEINCTTPQPELTSSTDAQAALYVWKGPNGFQEQSADIVVTEPGEYVLFVTDLVTGCIGSDTFTVEKNTEQPDADADLAQVNCQEGTALLSGTSSTPDVSFSWEGPNGFFSNDQNPVVAQQGFYTLTVTNPINGCMGNATYVLAANLTAPVALAQGGLLTCDQPTVVLQGAASVSQVTFQWIGPGGFSSNLPNPTVSLPGFYTLVVTDTTNGCVGSALAEVKQVAGLPGANPQGAVITCVIQQVVLTANPDQPGYEFFWTGPGGFSSEEENPLVEAGGIYLLTVTNPATGCAAFFEVVVVEDTTGPEILVDPDTLALTCIAPDIVLECPILIPEVLCTWQDSMSSSIQVSQPGVYYLILTSLNNGCTSTVGIVVKDERVVPDIAVSGDFELNCADDTTTLMVESSIPGVTFQWIGHTFPDVIYPVVGAGTYTVVAVDMNGCTNSETVTVTAPPALAAEVQVHTDCDGNVDIIPSISGGVPPYSMAVFYPSDTLISVILTDSNGCVLEIENIPLQVTQPLVLSLNSTDETTAGANDGTATVQPTGGTPPYQYLWTGGQTTSTIENLPPGDYFIVVTDANGCTETGTVTVQPGVSAACEIPGLQDLALFPNPAGSWVSLSLKLENPQTVQVQWTDVQGRVLQAMQQEVTMEETWYFDLRSFAPGVYFCKIMVNGKMTGRRVVKF